MTYPNKEYHYLQSGIPACSGTIGAGIAMIDACLVTGFNSKTITSISVTDNIATVNFTATTQSINVTNFIVATNFNVTCTFTAGTVGLYPGDIINISGATGTEQTKLNGTWTIVNVPTATTFTFIISTSTTNGTYTTTLGTTVKTNTGFVPDEIVLIAGANESVFNNEFKILTTPTTSSFTFALTTALSSATGTMTVKFAHLGWEKVYSGTNKAVYRSQDVTGTRLYLRVDDTNTQYMTVNMYETMSSVDVGTGMSTTLYWNKSSTANTTARNWYLVGNSKVFYILIFWHASYLNAAHPLSFGDFISCKAGDAYNCMLNAYTLAASNTPWDNCSMTSLNVVEVTGQFIARSYAQMGANIQFYKRAGCSGTGFGVLNDVSFPNPADNGIHLTPVYIYEASPKIYRGIMPGLFVPFETTNMAFLNRDKSIIPNGKQYVGYITAKAGSYGNCWFNLDEAWE